jgi:hypothetical protein
VGLVVAVLSIAIIAAATLIPARDQASMAADTSVWCLVCGGLGVTDVALNILLFVPLGIGLSLLGVSRWRGITLIVLTTLTVEVLQLSFIPGRDASLSDLLTNTIGGMLGLWLGPNLGKALFPAPPLAFRLAIATLVLWMLQQAFAAWAVAPVLPASVYYGQWAPELAQFDHFTGTVTSVTLNELPLGNGRFEATDRVRAELMRPEFELEVLAQSGTRTEKTAPIFSIFDDQQREILLLGTGRANLIFHLRTRLDPLRLRSPSIALPGAVPEDSGSTLSVRVNYDGARYRLQMTGESRVDSLVVPVSASWGWSFALPFSYDFGAGAPWLTALWLAGFWLVAGFWAAQSRRAPIVWWGLIAVTLVIGLGGIPTFFGLAVAAGSEWVAALAGAALGWAAGQGRNDRT